MSRPKKDVALDVITVTIFLVFSGTGLLLYLWIKGWVLSIH